MILDDARLVPAPGESGVACRLPGVVLYCAEREPADAVADLIGRCRRAAMSAEPGVVLIRQLAGLVNAAGREHLPSFAVIAATNQGLAVLVAGQLDLDVVTGEGHEHLSGTSSITYVDRLVSAECRSLTVHRPGQHPADTPSDLDLIRGVTAAGGVHVEARAMESAPPPSDPDASFASDPGPASGAPVEAPEPIETPAPAAPPASLAAPESPVPSAPAEPEPDEWEPPTAKVGDDAPPGPAPAPPPAEAAPPSAPPSPPPPPAPEAGDQRPPPPAPAVQPPPPPTPSAPAPPPPPTPVADAPSGPSTPPTPPADFDYVLLGAAGQDDEPAAAAEPLPVEPDPSEAREADSPAGEVMVRGTICSRGHFNDPRSRFCSSCGISMVHQTLNLVSGVRPPLGVLVFEDGTTYSLSANYVVGRQPEISALIRSGDALPLLLNDTGRTISRVHAELRLQEWDVYFVNLSATNGSFVFDRQSAQWQALPTNEPVKLAPGTRMAMGGRVAVFESSLVR